MTFILKHFHLQHIIQNNIHKKESMKCVCGGAESVLCYDPIEKKQQCLGKNFNKKKKTLSGFKALEN